jgi:ketosteroid isomerase-like protein
MASANAAAIRELYENFARGDVPAVLAAMSADIVWNEANNHPYADRNPYRGPQAIVDGIFMRCATEWDGFAVAIDDIIDGGDSVVALGHYHGTYKATGKPQTTQMAHVWRFRDGKAVAFQQYADTLHVARVTGG